MKIPKWFYIIGGISLVGFAVYIFVVIMAAATIYTGLNNAIARYEKPDTTITIHNGKPDTLITIKNK